MTPNFNDPLDIKAFIKTELYACVCIEWGEVIHTLFIVLEWIKNGCEPNYRKKFENVLGFYYLIEGILEYTGLCEHGISCRYPWLTPKGTQFLNGLRNNSIEKIEAASGTAYDGYIVS